MSNQNASNMGDHIQSMVENAVDAMDFDLLEKNIRGSIESVFDELNITVPSGMERPVRTKEAQENINNSVGYARQKNNTKPVFVVNPPGGISGPVLTGLGAIFTGIFGFTTFIMLVLALLVSEISVASMITIASILPFLALSIISLVKGRKLSGHLKKFRSFKHIIGRRKYCSVEELADASNMSVEDAIKEIHYMIDKRFFTCGHLDRQNTCLMLDKETYETYLDAQTSFDERAANIKETADEEAAVFSSDGLANQELAAAIEEGNRYIREIRRANEAIPGEVITEKLNHMEELILKIFEVLKQKPEQLPKLRKFMNYYMPTTLKLVQAYQELDAQPVQGENITKSKIEIEKTFDTINLAYEKLLDRFFEDAGMDIRTDISVLQTMLAQEGLTADQFQKR